MEIFDDKQKAGPGCDHLEEMEDRLEEAQPGLNRVTALGGHAAQARKEVSELSSRTSKLLPQGLDIDLSHVIAQRLEERQVRQCQVRFGASAAEHDCADPSGALAKLGRQPSLTHAGVTREQHHSPFAAHGGKERILQVGQLTFPPDEHRTKGPNHGHDAANASGR
jgi:hypothetical protein